jgi:hypothetical protein
MERKESGGAGAFAAIDQRDDLAHSVPTGGYILDGGAGGRNALPDAGESRSVSAVPGSVYC